MAKYTTTVASRKTLRQLLINNGGDAELWALIKPKECTGINKWPYKHIDENVSFVCTRTEQSDL